MATETRVNDGGTWRFIDELKVNDGGTWRDIQQAYVNDGGTWRSVFVKITINLVNDTILAVSGGAATASYRLDADGDITQILTGVSSDIGDWITPKSEAGGDYEVRATHTGGTAPTGSALGTWLALSADRTWTVTSFAGTVTGNITVEIRRASDSVVLDSAAIVLQAVVI